MNTWTVRTRMLMGFGLLIALLVVSIAFSLVQQNKLADLTDKQYQHPFMVTNAVARADGNIVRMSRLMKDIAMVKDDAEIVKLTQQVDALEQKVIEDLTFAKSRYLTSPEEMEKLIQLFKTWKPIRDQVIALKREGKSAEAGELTRTAGGPKLNEIFASSQKIYDTAMKKAESFYDMSTDSKESSFYLTLFLGLLIVIVGAAAALLISRSVIRQIGGEPTEVVAIAQQLAVGNFNVSSQSAPAKGSVLDAVIQLKNVLHAVVSESNQVIAGLARGQFDGRIQGEYSGELAALKTGVNQSAEIVSSTMDQLTSLMQNLRNGNFDARIDLSAEGKFLEIAQLAVKTMDTLSKVISEVNQSMHAINQGRFDLRVNTEAHGDLLFMKTSINQTIDTLDALTNDLVNLAEAQLQGDLTKHAQGRYAGRFQVLQDARAASTDKIKEVIAAAMSASYTVTEAATQVAQGSSDLSSRVQQQAAAIEETSATMNQMSGAVKANTENANQVAQLAHQVQDQAGEGVLVMQKTISAMQSIQESSVKIANIVSLIDGIAFQTNLLALNAAVEAARAGEHGRGFAVVASEVRVLAQKSAEAAKDIKELIDDSVHRVQNGTQLAEKSGEVLGGIASAVEQVVTMIEAIATASNEQSSGIGHVHLAIANIDSVTQQNANLVEETTLAAESLSQQADTLISSMSFFNIGSEFARKVQAPSKPTKKTTKPVALLSSGNKHAADTWSEF